MVHGVRLIKLISNIDESDQSHGATPFYPKFVNNQLQRYDTNNADFSIHPDSLSNYQYEFV